MVPTLYRVQSGRLFFDDFAASLGPPWRVEPEAEASRVNTSDRPGWLRITPGARCFVLAPLPDGDLVVEAEVEYEPQAAGEFGGLVLYAGSPDEWAGVLEQIDSASQVTGWRHLRLVRTGERWDAYASHDRVTWDWLGAQRFGEAADFGLVLEGSTALDVDAVRVYRATTIRVEDVHAGWTAQLVAEDGQTVRAEATVPTGETAAVIDVSRWRFPLAGYIRVRDGTGAVVRESPLLEDIWGGDIYRAEIMVAVYDEAGNLLPWDQEWDFGEVPGGQHARRLELRNDTGLDLSGLSVAVVAAPETFGASWVDVALDTGGAPGPYADTVTVESLPSGASAYVWVRVTRGIDGPPADRYRFGLRVTIP